MNKLKGYRLTIFKNDEPYLSSIFKFRTFKDGEKAGLMILSDVRRAGVNGISFTVFQHY